MEFSHSELLARLVICDDVDDDDDDVDDVDDDDGVAVLVLLLAVFSVLEGVYNDCNKAEDLVTASFSSDDSLICSPARVRKRLRFSPSTTPKPTCCTRRGNTEREEDEEEDEEGDEEGEEDVEALLLLVVNAAADDDADDDDADDDADDDDADDDAAGVVMYVIPSLPPCSL